MKKMFIVYLEVGEEILKEATNDNHITEILKEKLAPVGNKDITIGNIFEEYRSPNTAILPLSITVVDGKVDQIWYDNEWGIDYCLNASDFSVTYETSK